MQAADALAASPADDGSAPAKRMRPADDEAPALPPPEYPAFVVASAPGSLGPALAQLLPQGRALPLVGRLSKLTGELRGAASNQGLLQADAPTAVTGAPMSGELRAVLGFDCEWDVSYVRGAQAPVSVVQLGTSDNALIIHLPGVSPDGSGGWGMPDELRAVLEDESVALLGVNCGGDAQKLFRDFGVRTRGLVDVAALWGAAHGRCGPGGRPVPLSLKRLAQEALGVVVPKEDEVRKAAWSRSDALTAERARYAALDAAIPVRAAGPALDALDAAGRTARAGWGVAFEQQYYGRSPRGARAGRRTPRSGRVTPAAAYAASASLALARLVAPGPGGERADAAAAMLSRLPWQRRAHALWMWRLVPSDRLPSSLSKAPSDVLAALLRSIEHREALGVPAHRPVVLSSRDGGAWDAGSDTTGAASSSSSSSSSPADDRLPDAPNGLPYRWSDMKVRPEQESACLRQLRCLEAESGLAGSVLDPLGSAPTTTGPVPTPPTPAGTPPAAGWHPVHGPRTAEEAASASPPGVSRWAIQLAVDGSGCITAHQGVAAAEWPAGAADHWPRAVTSLTLPLPVAPEALSEAWVRRKRPEDRDPDPAVMRCVLAHASRMGMRGVVVVKDASERAPPGIGRTDEPPRESPPTAAAAASPTIAAAPGDSDSSEDELEPV